VEVGRPDGGVDVSVAIAMTNERLFYTNIYSIILIFINVQEHIYLLNI